MRSLDQLSISTLGARGIARSLLTAGTFMLLASAADAQTVKLVVPIPAGGAGDILARVLADQIARTEGATIVVENRPGGSTLIGTEAVARAAPDGSSLLVAGTGFVINPHLRKTNYDPLTSFEPVCHLANLPTVIVVKSSSPYAKLADLLDAASARPGQLTLASIGPASTAHIAFETLKRAAKADMTFVPFPGTAPALNALLGDHVTSFLGNYAEVAEHLKAGTLRALATVSTTRIQPAPNLPTLAELGYKVAVGEIWYGLVAPAKTPKQIIAQLSRWFTAASQAPDVQAKLVAKGIYPAITCGADYYAFLSSQSDEYGRAIRETKIQP
jgi:tripartite-type tricarboxylate transporter receptor subunit TctC